MYVRVILIVRYNDERDKVVVVVVVVMMMMMMIMTRTTKVTMAVVLRQQRRKWYRCSREFMRIFKFSELTYELKTHYEISTVNYSLSS